ncbi:unannotated protein [freshwater metagenome]|uniref:Unannotated protein n=1 Tax=freshwater metagenome TaxID=449393 RepID=A0A6J7FGK8_9ZZZZ|nr:hypothetical protein [Actinomycetota bacterium]
MRLFGPRSTPPAPELGVNLVGFTRTDFSRTASTGSMVHLRETLGATRAVLVPTFYGSRFDAGQIAAESPKTATVASLRDAIQDAARHGVAVALKPHLDIEDGVFRGDIAPTGADRARFFDTYRRVVIAPLARLAAEHPGTVDRFVVGTELSGLAGADDEWRATVRELRRVAPGVQVGFAANYDSLVPGDRRPNPTGWADELDFVGVDYFLGESDRDYAPGRLTRSIKTVKRLTGKPVIFTELGSRADTPDGHEGQRRRIAAAIDHFTGHVSAFWLWNRFAVRDETDVERYTLGDPAVQELARRF